MGSQSTDVQPRHLPGSNLAPGEALRLILLLCGPPWLFGAFIILTGLAVAPATALGWILYVAAGPAAWGTFISAVADGRTLLGRPKDTNSPSRRLWTEIRIEGESVVTHGNVNVVHGDLHEGPARSRTDPH